MARPKERSSPVREHIPCPCGKSSDAYCTYDDGHGWCYSCNKFFEEDKTKKESRMEKIVEILDPTKLTYEVKPQRGWTKETVEFFDIVTKIYDGVDYSIGYAYPNGAIKERRLGEVDKKDRFKWNKTEDGEAGKGLYGMDKFPKGSFKTLTISEGPADAPSIFQATNRRTAAVSVDSAATAVREITENFEYVDSFEKIILAFDKDEAGDRALKGVLTLFQNPEKIYILDMAEGKDPNDYVREGKSNELYVLWNNAKKSLPSDFIHTFVEVAESLTESVHDVVGTYPLPKLQEALRGLVRGEMTVFKGPEGIGKTELFRVFEYHLLKMHPEAKIGVIHAEEDKSTTLKGIATHESGIPMYFEEDEIPLEEVMDAYRKAVGDDENRFFVYKVRGTDDPRDVLRSIRALVVGSGVNIVFLDNLQKLVDAIEEDRERQMLVYLSAKLKEMAQDLRFSLVVISHVNDDGKALGSRYITKVADKVVHLSRDIKSTDPLEANRLYLEIEKGRMARGQGKVGYLQWNSTGYRLEVPTQAMKKDVTPAEGNLVRERIFA